MTKAQRIFNLLSKIVLCVAILLACNMNPAQAADAPSSKVTSLFSDKLPNVPGKTMTVVVVDYPPGGRSLPHHHAGFVFAYVLSGAVQSQISGGKLTIYKVGEQFIEPPGSHHLVSANASDTEPARMLAVIIADEGAPLTAVDK